MPKFLLFFITAIALSITSPALAKTKTKSKTGPTKSVFLTKTQFKKLKPPAQITYLKSVQKVFIQIESKTSPKGWGGIHNKAPERFALRFGPATAQAQTPVGTHSEQTTILAFGSVFDGNGNKVECGPNNPTCMIAGWPSCRGVDGKCKIPDEARCNVEQRPIGVKCSPIFGFNSGGEIECLTGGSFNNASQNCSQKGLTLDNLSTSQISSLGSELEAANETFNRVCGERSTGDCGIWKTQLAAAATAAAAGPVAAASAESAQTAGSADGLPAEEIKPIAAPAAAAALAGVQPLPEVERPEVVIARACNAPEPKPGSKFKFRCAKACADGSDVLVVEKYDAKKSDSQLEKVFLYQGKTSDLAALGDRDLENLYDKKGIVSCHGSRAKESETELRKLSAVLAGSAQCDLSLSAPLAGNNDFPGFDPAKKKYPKVVDNCGNSKDDQRQVTFTDEPVVKSGTWTKSKIFEVKLERKIRNLWVCNGQSKATVATLHDLLGNQDFFKRAVCADSPERTEEVMAGLQEQRQRSEASSPRNGDSTTGGLPPGSSGIGE